MYRLRHLRGRLPKGGAGTQTLAWWRMAGSRRAQGSRSTRTSAFTAASAWRFGPTYALTMSVNDQPENPVMTWETFPKLIRSVAVQPKELEVKQAVACIEACPTDVISPDGRAGMLKVDESGCIYCHQCEALAPETFSVISPWGGLYHPRRKPLPVRLPRLRGYLPQAARSLGATITKSTWTSASVSIAALARTSAPPPARSPSSAPRFATSRSNPRPGRRR